KIGTSPRVLVRLQLDGSGGDDLPAPGADISVGGRTVGRLGTVVQHHEEGPVALASLKRSVPADAALDIDGTAASVAPDTAPGEAGPHADRAATRPLR